MANNRIRFQKPDAEGNKVSVETFETAGRGYVKLSINEENLTFKVLDATSHQVVTEGPEKKVNSHVKLKLRARNALKALGAPLQDEKREKRSLKTKSEHA